MHPVLELTMHQFHDRHDRSRRPADAGRPTRAMPRLGGRRRSGPPGPTGGSAPPATGRP